MDKEIRCYGCGAIIQNKDNKKIGYVPKDIIDENVLCQRCFKLRHYHQLSTTNLSKDDYLKIIQTIGNKDCLVIYIIDIFDFEGSLIKGVSRHVGGNDIFVLANKRDVLPSSINDTKIVHWIYRQFKKEGLKVKDVEITSGLKKLNLDIIYEKIEKYRKNRDVYVIGVSNVGKSTFINSLLKHYASINDQYLITVSEFPGTTLDLISIPLDNKTYLYDSPGIINDNSIIHYLDAEDIDIVVPKKEIKPITYQLDSLQTLYFAGIVRMDYLEGNSQGFTCYFSRNVKIHRTKLNKADELFNNHKALQLQIKDINNINNMIKYDFSLKDKCDIYIAGLGFIKVNGKGGIVRVFAPKGVLVIKRDALI